MNKLLQWANRAAAKAAQINKDVASKGFAIAAFCDKSATVTRLNPSRF